MIALLFFLLGCETPLTPIEGTTIRVGTRDAGKAELALRIFRDDEECYGGAISVDRDLCPPFIDRASGQVRFSFQPRLSMVDVQWPMILEKEDLSILHNKNRVPIGDIKLTGHEPMPTPQIYILLLDVSGSMRVQEGGSGPRRIDRIRSALMKESVIKSFFPKGVNSIVVPMVFSSGVPLPLGEKLLIDNAEDYKKTIQYLDVGVKVGLGYTHLYKAVGYAATELLAKPEIKQKLEGQNAMSPTIIALTDGFNNEDDIRGDRSKDQCKDNVPRLQTLISTLEEIHRKSAVTARPAVYTVGLGKPAAKKSRKLRDMEQNGTLPRVTDAELCGAMTYRQIDGDVENYGVDNVALEWIATAGHGKTYVKQDSRGLADAFQSAAANKYRWYDVRYKVDPFYLRRKFKIRLNFIWGSDTSSTALEILPSGWLDGPQGVPFDGEWVRAAPYSQSAALIFPAIGLITTLIYLPAAAFNLRRILFNRIRRK